MRYELHQDEEFTATVDITYLWWDMMHFYCSPPRISNVLLPLRKKKHFFYLFISGLYW